MALSPCVGARAFRYLLSLRRSPQLGQVVHEVPEMSRGWGISRGSWWVRCWGEGAVLTHCGVRLAPAPFQTVSVLFHPPLRGPPAKQAPHLPFQVPCSKFWGTVLGP